MARARRAVCGGTCASASCAAQGPGWAWLLRCVAGGWAAKRSQPVSQDRRQSAACRRWRCGAGIMLFKYRPRTLELVDTWLSIILNDSKIWDQVRASVPHGRSISTPRCGPTRHERLGALLLRLVGHGDARCRTRSTSWWGLASTSPWCVRLRVHPSSTGCVMPRGQRRRPAAKPQRSPPPGSVPAALPPRRNRPNGSQQASRLSKPCRPREGQGTKSLPRGPARSSHDGHPSPPAGAPQGQEAGLGVEPDLGGGRAPLLALPGRAHGLHTKAVRDPAGQAAHGARHLPV